MKNGTIARFLRYAACSIAAVALTQTAMGQAGVFQNPPADLGTETMPVNDGWASQSGNEPGPYTSFNVTGGSAALPANIYTVSTFAQLKNALQAGGSTTSNVAKIIYVSGQIVAVDKNGAPLGPPTLNGTNPCTAYNVSPYTESAYIASISNTSNGSTAQINALNSSETGYKPYVVLPVGSNTTIAGIGTTAGIKGINLTVSSPVTNVIIRNITFSDSIDCYPAWQFNDYNPVNPFYQAVDSSFPGNFNSNFDNISMLGAKNWWVDHCHFTDQPDDDSTENIFLNRPYQWHDGALDITNASDLGTVSWSIFEDHGKTNLIGGSDSAATSSDNGHLRVTFHHNMWKNAEERQPRVRAGEIDLYDNFYNIGNGPGYSGFVYAWGAGVNSHIYATNNAFVTNGAADVFGPNQIVYDYSNLTQSTVCVQDARWDNPDVTVDPVALANAAIASWPSTDTVSATQITVAQTLAAAATNHTTPIVPGCTYWTPPARLAAPDNTQDVPALVLSGAVASPSVNPVPAFGPVTYGQNTSQTVTLNNNGAGVLLINSVTATGDFSVSSNNCQGSLAASSSCQLSVTFAPSAQGSRTGTLSFSDWASGSPQTVSLSGTGMAAPLTVTANNTSRLVGAVNPAFTASYGGFVNGDTPASLGGSPSLTTTATASSGPGLYPITAAVGTITDTNYTYSFVNGTLSVVAAPSVTLTTTSTVSGSNGAGYTATITVQNTGATAATNVTLNTVTLGTASGTPLPQAWGTIGAGGSATFIVSFPGSAGLDNAGVAEKISGTYTGGTFSASIRSVTLP
jgi:pectate lyase